MVRTSDLSVVRYAPSCRKPSLAWESASLQSAEVGRFRPPCGQMWWSALWSDVVVSLVAHQLGCDPLFRRCRTVVRCSFLPGEIARTRLIAGHVIRLRWRRLWVSRTTSGCRWVMSSTTCVSCVLGVPLRLYDLGMEPTTVCYQAGFSLSCPVSLSRSVSATGAWIFSVGFSAVGQLWLGEGEDPAR